MAASQFPYNCEMRPLRKKTRDFAACSANRVRLTEADSQIFPIFKCHTIALAFCFATASLIVSPHTYAQTAPPMGNRDASIEVVAPYGGTPALRIVPRLELNERFTDNVSQVSTSLATSDWITDATGGLAIDYRSARATAKLDYHVNHLFHNKVRALDTTLHNLDSYATLEAVEKWLFLDARASITQQSRSAFGAANIADIASTRGNRIETRTYQFSPYVRGYLTDAATYLIRVNGTETRTGDSAFPDARTYQWNSLVKNAPSAGRFGWSIDGNGLSINNNAIGKRENSFVRGSVSFEVVQQAHLSASIGRESSDLDGKDTRNTNSPGLGLEWSPSPRTQLAAVTQRRFFGNDHLLVFAHRTPLTAWRLTSTKEIAFSTSELATSNTVSVSNLLLDLLAASIPDPNARIDAAKRKFEQTGIPAASGISDGFLTVRPFLSRREDVSFAMLGPRSTLTFAVGRREQRAIEANNANPTGGAPVQEIRQYVANSAWAYRLTPVSTLRMVVSYLRTEGLFLKNLSTSQRHQSLVLVTELGPHTSASIGLQNLLFDSTVESSFREKAVAASLSLRF